MSVRQINELQFFETSFLRTHFLETLYFEALKNNLKMVKLTSLNLQNIEKINDMIYLKIVKYYNKTNHFFGYLLNLMEIIE